jgi:hypothetical protein
LGVPRWAFGQYTWITLLYGDNLILELRDVEMERNMDLDEVERRTKGLRARFPAVN